VSARGSGEDGNRVARGTQGFIGGVRISEIKTWLTNDENEKCE
jgi:hypothetical protein